MSVHNATQRRRSFRLAWSCLSNFHLIVYESTSLVLLQWAWMSVIIFSNIFFRAYIHSSHRIVLYIIPCAIHCFTWNSFYAYFCDLLIYYASPHLLRFASTNLTCYRYKESSISMVPNGTSLELRLSISGGVTRKDIVSYFLILKTNSSISSLDAYGLQFAPMYAG